MALPIGVCEPPARQTSDGPGLAQSSTAPAIARRGWLDVTRQAATVHLVGAAGTGMQALAAVLSGAGATITGSDISIADASDSNGAAGGSIAAASMFRGHSARNIPADCGLVVYSPAVDESNVEIADAQARGIPCLSYPQMLGRLMSQRSGAAVAGTHGKTSTTAMAASILCAAGLDPTVVVGGVPCGETSGGRYGQGDWLLAEACEYRGHFAQLAPQVAAILNIEWDHVDCFASSAAVEAAFEQFAARVAADGVLIVAGECAASRRVARRAAAGRRETFAVENRADWQASNVRQRRGRFAFEILLRGGRLGTVALRVPGRHQVANALAAAALAWHCGADAAAIESGLNHFSGVRRRLELVGDFDGVALVDDYAHHPTEIRASLAALWEWFPGRRLRCVFQPHQASRTRALLDDFAQSLHNADDVVVAEVVLAREPQSDDAAGLAAELARRVRDFGRSVADVHRLTDIGGWLRQTSLPGDVVVTMGAGDIWKVGAWVR